jgi:hypothetical protein
LLQNTKLPGAYSSLKASRPLFSGGYLPCLEFDNSNAVAQAASTGIALGHCKARLMDQSKEKHALAVVDGATDVKDHW